MQFKIFHSTFVLYTCRLKLIKLNYKPDGQFRCRFITNHGVWVHWNTGSKVMFLFSQSMRAFSKMFRIFTNRTKIISSDENCSILLFLYLIFLRFHYSMVTVVVPLDYVGYPLIRRLFHVALSNRDIAQSK